MKSFMSEFTRTDEEIKKLSEKIHYAKYVFICFFLIIAMRLWYLQVYKGPDLRLYSENNRLKKQVIQAPRGLILDRDHKILAKNRLQSELLFTPQYSKNIQKSAAVIGQIIEAPLPALTAKIKKSQKERGLFFPVSLKKNLSLDQIYRLKLLKENFPEISIRDYIVRFYPFKELGAHLLGYTGEISKSQISQFNKSFKNSIYFRPGDIIGQSGLEMEWERKLRGQDGLSFVEVDAHSRYTPIQSKTFWNLQPQKPVDGKHLILTIDLDIQRAAFQAMKKRENKKGAVVAMKSNGEILALLSFPAFDPNSFSKALSQKDWKKALENPFNPFLNKAIQNHYPPGSIIKPILALAALQENIIGPTTLIHSPSKIRIGRRTFHDHKQIGYGNINLHQAIEESSNTFFYQIGQKIGIDLMAFYFKKFGFGQKTNIRLAREVSGFVPTSKWKEKTFKEKWQAGEDLVHAIGQGYLLTTPLQTAVAYNAIATGGKIVKPYIVQSIIDSKNKILNHFSSKTLNDLSKSIDSEHFETVTKAMTQVLHGAKGTARWWKLKDHLTAGKTGTSQVRSFNRENLYKDCRKKPLQDRNHGWFAAFAPANNPEITVAVLTEHSCSGSSGSAPIVRDILKAYFKKYPVSSENFNVSL